MKSVSLPCLQDLAGQPQQLGDGTLRTPGVIDFFRMLNEQVKQGGAWRDGCRECEGLSTVAQKPGSLENPQQRPSPSGRGVSFPEALETTASGEQGSWRVWQR